MKDGYVTGPAAIDRIRAEQIELVYRGSVPGTLGAAVAGTILVVMMVAIGELALAGGIAFLLAVYINTAIRVGLTYAYGRAAPPAEARRAWARRIHASVLLGGFVWGLGGMLLMPADSLEFQLIILVVILAIASGSVSAFGASVPTFLMSFIPMVLPPMIWMALRGDLTHEALAAMGILWMFVIVALARRLAAATEDSLRLRFENLDLVEDLQRQKAEAEEQRELAERANLAKSRFLASASHDLRQPVHALGMFVGALRARPLDPEAVRLVEHIDGSIDAMDGLFASLLDISRLDAGMTRAHLGPVPLRPLIEQVCREYRPTAMEKGIRLIACVSSQTVVSDPVLLGRILRNLVANAVRYTNRGQVLVGCRRGARISLEVWDTGVGIPADEHENIFQEFYQLGNPERDRIRGLGLGLAIVKRLVTLVDAELTLRSHPGMGSVFKVALPRAHSAAVVPEAVKASATLPASGMILVIDDEVAIQAATESLLSNWGYRVAVAGSYDEMVERIADYPALPDLIICDYRLRGVEDGAAVIRRLRGFYNEDIPALLITGDTAIKGAAESGFMLLHKPLGPEALRNAIGAELSRREPAG